MRLLRPAAVTCTELVRRPLLARCSLGVAVGLRLLVVSEPDASASMLLRILAGLSRPERGHVTIAGLRDPSTAGWGRRVAYVGPHPGIRAWMTPREVLQLAAGLLELPTALAARRLARALAWAGIGSEAADRPVRRGGPPIAQRTSFAAALMADPEVLLLDEPLRALDGEERSRLLRLPGRRRTLVMASRDPASEDGIATHLCFIREGRVALLARVADLAAAGLPLSMPGIVELAARQRPRPVSPRAASAAAAGR